MENYMDKVILIIDSNNNGDHFWGENSCFKWNIPSMKIRQIIILDNMPFLYAFNKI